MLTQKEIDSKINAAAARLEQVKNSNLFTIDEKNKQISQLEKELSQLANLKEVKI